MGNHRIDWVDATRGAPAADVARTMVLFKYAAMPPDIDEDTVRHFEELRYAFVEEYLSHYGKLTGIAGGEINRWLIPIAAARLVNEQIPENERMRLAEVVHTGLSMP